MPAASNAAMIRELTASLSGVSSSGAKKTPATRRSMNWAHRSHAAVFLLRRGGIRRAAAGEERMVAGTRGCRQTLDNRFEDFCLRQVRDQEPEREAARERLVLRAPHVGAGAGPPLDQPVLLQISQRPPDGDPRRAKRLHQVGFAWQPLARTETIRL